jgi:hypothetical protein
LKQTQISQQLMRVMHMELMQRGKVLAPDQQDCLMMIAVKISRIINGDENHADNFKDIAGYATLVADRLEGKSR